MPPAFRTMRILWAALLGSVLLLAFANASIPVPKTTHPPDDVMLYAISAVAVVDAVISFLLPAKIKRQAFAHMPPFREGDATDSEALRARVVRFQTPFILSLALSESVALFGFVLGRLGFSMMTVAPFFAAGALLMLVRFPTLRSLER